jgi:3-hydroxy-D-aspartate aldolase
MNVHSSIDEHEVGFDIPAKVGMDEKDIQTPCLVLDLDALERNIKKMGDYAKAHGMRHRVHGKMHKSVDVALLQQKLGGAVGVCCQKVSEAEVFARGGIKDVLVSNQVTQPEKIDRLARMPKLGARTICCVDDMDNIPNLSAAAVKHGTQIECLVEIDCGAGRCGVTTTPQVVELAKAIDAAPGLKFAGIQAYQGAMQHIDSFEERKGKTDIAIAMVRDASTRSRPRGSSATSSAEAEPAAIISSPIPASSTSFSAAPTPSWMPITAASTTRTASGSTRASGKTRCSSSPAS